MSQLPLAIDIADAVSGANRDEVPFDVRAKSEELRDAHPEADATAEDIADALHAVENEDWFH